MIAAVFSQSVSSTGGDALFERQHAHVGIAHALVARDQHLDGARNVAHFDHALGLFEWAVPVSSGVGQLVLRTEQANDSLFRHARSRRDLLQADLVVIALTPQVVGRLQDAFARALSRIRASLHVIRALALHVTYGNVN